MIRVPLYRNRAVAVLGLARSGLAAARALSAGGARVLCWDDAPDARAAARDQGFEVRPAGPEDGIAALVPSPGVPLSHPMIAAAHDAGVMCGRNHRVRKRHAGARHQGSDPVLGPGGAHLEALIARRRPRIRRVVPAEHARAAGTERPRRGEAGACEPEHGDRAIAIEGNPDHWLTSASASRARSGRGSRRSPRSG